MFFYCEPNFIEKFLRLSVFFFFFFFKFWPKSKWREIKIGYLAAILKRYNILIFFRNDGFLIVHTSPDTYMMQISLQNSGGKLVFLGGSYGTPLGINGSKSTLVKSKILTKFIILKNVLDFNDRIKLIKIYACNCIVWNKFTW